MVKSSRKREGMKNKISKSNIYAIKYLLDKGFRVDEISSEINLTTEHIEKIIESEGLANKEAAIKKPKDLMINETAVKRNKTVSIMTKEASMQLDHKTPSLKTHQSDTHIFKPFK